MRGGEKDPTIDQQMKFMFVRRTSADVRSQDGKSIFGLIWHSTVCFKCSQLQHQSPIRPKTAVFTHLIAFSWAHEYITSTTISLYMWTAYDRTSNLWLEKAWWYKLKLLSRPLVQRCLFLEQASWLVVFPLRVETTSRVGQGNGFPLAACLHFSLVSYCPETLSIVSQKRKCNRFWLVP